MTLVYLPILLSVATLLSSQTQALEYEVPYENASIKPSLSDAVNQYITFINRLSHGEDFDQFAAAEAIVSPDCKKIFNGQLVTSSCDAFVQDLLQVYKTHGSWTINPAEVFIIPKSNTAIVRLFVDIESLGKFTEILILRFNQNQLISELNIVFNKVQDGYNFDSK